MQKLLAILFFVPALLFGQQNWKWQNPLPQGKGVNSISIIDSNNVFGAGDNGLILKTLDGGINWKVIETGYVNNLLTIFFIDSLHGWAGGENGIILRTTDGGLTFSRQDSGIGTYNINSIFFISNDNGFATCSNGVLLTTVNGGYNWNPVTFNPQVPLSKIYFADNNNGWLIGGNGTIKKTTNSGVNWINQSSNVTNILSSISFTDQNYGWVCGQSGVVLKTTDGGINWVKSNSTTQNWLLSISFMDQNTGIAVGRNGVILRTEDGGNSWGKEVHDSSLTFNCISISNTGNGMLAGSSGFLARSSDAGINWDFQSSGDRVNMNSIYFISHDIGFIAGDKGTIYKTTDGGNSWVKKESNTTVNLNDISYYNHYYWKNIWAAGDSATVIISTDIGETWVKYDYHKFTYYNFRTISAENPLNCFIGGDNGTLIQVQVTKGNLTSLLSTGLTGNIRNFFWLTPTLGFCVGQSRQNGIGVFSSIHISYSAIKPTYASDVSTNFSFSDLNQVTFQKTLGNTYSSKYGFAVGRFGVLIKTTDLGKTWNKYTVDITEGKGVYFVDTLNGYICGSNGEILKSTDSGINWTKLSTHIRTTLSRIYFQDTNTGWIIGPNGLIMKTDNGGGGIASGVNDNSILTPKAFSLFQNFPNPFNPETRINYLVSQRSNVLIRVYNILGKEISTLVNEIKEAGNYNIEFNGGGYPSGIYFCRMQAGSFTETRKMILLK